MKHTLYSIIICIAAFITACTQPSKLASPAQTIGNIAIWDEAAREVISENTPIEVLATGFQWSEGPAWDPVRKQLYFSDVPKNKAYDWSEKNGLNTFLDPSGIPLDQAGGFREPGTNGLLMMPGGQLLMANHGKRALELINVESKARTAVVTTFEGQTLNSPNDMVRAKDGMLYFTDPPYGLAGLNASPLKQLPFSGVYQLSTNGNLKVIDTAQTFPNGIALSPDERALYVAVSDSEIPKIMKYTKDAEGSFTNGQLWFDAKPYQDKGLPGLPDGMAVADSGHIFATGPGGVFILSPDGKALGQIQTGRATANCTFGDDGKSLYITAGDILVRVRLLKGVQL